MRTQISIIGLVVSIIYSSVASLHGQCEGSNGVATKYGKIKFELLTIVSGVGNQFAITQFCTDPSGQVLEVDGICFPESKVARIGACPITWCLKDGILVMAGIEFDQKDNLGRVIKEVSGLFGEPEITIGQGQTCYLWPTQRGDDTIMLS